MTLQHPADGKLRHWFHEPDNIFIFTVIVGSAVLLLPLVGASFSFGSEWRQTDTASIAHHFYINGYQVLYPQIFWGGAGPGYVESEFQLYPFLVALLYGLFGEHVWLGRFVSLLFSIGSLVGLALVNRRLVGPSTANWALLVVAFSPLFLTYGTAFMPEATVFFFYVFALNYFLRWLTEESATCFILSMISTSIAILVKPTSGHLGLLFALLIWHKAGISAFRKPTLWLGAIATLAVPAIWYAHARDLYFQYGNTFGLFSGGDNKFGDISDWLNPHFYLSLALIDAKWILSLVGVIPFFVGLWDSRKGRPMSILWGAGLTIFIYYAITAKYSGSEDAGIHYHIYALPFVAIVAGLGFDRIRSNDKTVLRNVILWCIGITFLFVSCVTWFKAFSRDETVAAACARSVAGVVPAGSLILVSSATVSTNNGQSQNYQDPRVFFYAKRYGWSLPRDQHNSTYLGVYREKGAEYFVILRKNLDLNTPDLRAYLAEHATRVDARPDCGCEVYKFRQVSSMR